MTALSDGTIYKSLADAYEATLGGEIPPLLRDKTFWSYRKWLCAREYGARVGRQVVLDEEKRDEIVTMITNFEAGIDAYGRQYLPTWVGIFRLALDGLAPVDKVIERGRMAKLKPNRRVNWGDDA